MGLNQVRDLRQASTQAILAERQAGHFGSLADLVQRAPLQAKELVHLIRCGALDGLGAAALPCLTMRGRLPRGSRQQIAFGFMVQQIEAEAPAERLAWEQHIIGQPVSVHPLDLVAMPGDECIPLAVIADRPRQAVQVVGVRLPGWTGGKGFFLADRTHYLIAIPPRSIADPPPWEPVQIWGRWLADEWGGGWLQIERLEKL